MNSLQSWLLWWPPLLKLDFTTALARLLSERRLREAYRLDPEQLAEQLLVAEVDIKDFISLNSDELDAQAAVLIRKRLKPARHNLPDTFAQLGPRAYTEYWEYAADTPLTLHACRCQDPLGFCHYLEARDLGWSCEGDRNRLDFRHHSTKLKIHWIRCGKQRWGLQILYRLQRHTPCELRIGFI